MPCPVQPCDIALLHACDAHAIARSDFATASASYEHQTLHRIACVRMHQHSSTERLAMCAGAVPKHAASACWRRQRA